MYVDAIDGVYILIYKRRVFDVDLSVKSSRYISKREFVAFLLAQQEFIGSCKGWEISPSKSATKSKVEEMFLRF